MMKAVKSVLLLGAALALLGCSGPWTSLSPQSAGTVPPTPVAPSDARLVFQLNGLRALDYGYTVSSVALLTVQLKSDTGLLRFGQAASTGTGTFQVDIKALPAGDWGMRVQLFDTQSTLLYYGTKVQRIEPGITTNPAVELYKPGDLGSLTLQVNNPTEMAIVGPDGKDAPGTAPAVLRTGTSVVLSPRTLGSAGLLLKDQSVTWTSSAPEVAAVAADGRLTAGALGTALITARCAVSPDVVGTYSVSVLSPLTGLWVLKGTQDYDTVTGATSYKGYRFTDAGRYDFFTSMATQLPTHVQGSVSIQGNVVTLTPDQRFDWNLGTLVPGPDRSMALQYGLGTGTLLFTTSGGARVMIGSTTTSIFAPDQRPPVTGVSWTAGAEPPASLVTQGPQAVVRISGTVPATARLPLCALTSSDRSVMTVGPLLEQYSSFLGGWTLVPLAEGTANLEVRRLEDMMVVASYSVVVGPDTTLPVLTVNYPPIQGGTGTEADPYLTYPNQFGLTVTDDVAITAVEYSNDGVTWIPVTNTYDANWYADILESGLGYPLDKRVRIRAVNAAGLTTLYDAYYRFSY